MKPFALALLLVAACGACAAQVQPTPPAPSCRVKDLSLSIDSTHNGDFDGMSHAGTVLVLRNISDSACTLMPFVPVIFGDATHMFDLQVVAPGARFMHHGPMMRVTVLQPGEKAAASARWTSAPVYTDPVCFDATRLTATLSGQSKSVAFTAHICGGGEKKPVVEVSHFAAGDTAPGQKSKAP